MHRWTHNAAGGMSQRLYPGAATVRSLRRNDKTAILPPISNKSALGVLAVSTPFERTKCARLQYTCALGPSTNQPALLLALPLRASGLDGSLTPDVIPGRV